MTNDTKRLLGKMPVEKTANNHSGSVSVENNKHEVAELALKNLETSVDLLQGLLDKLKNEPSDQSVTDSKNSRSFTTFYRGLPEDIDLQSARIKDMTNELSEILL